MKTILILLAVLTFQACDAPIRERSTPLPTKDQDYTPGTGTGYGFTEPGQEDPGPTPSPTTDPNMVCQSIPSSESPTLGAMSVCQNKTNLAQVKVNFQRSNPNMSICFVPLHVTNCGGSSCPSFKLGSGECTTLTAGVEKSMSLNQERPDILNGVMILPQVSLRPYMDCMNARVDFIRANQGCEYDQRCIDNANAYANNVCTSFKTYHSQYYKQVKFFTAY